MVDENGLPWSWEFQNARFTEKLRSTILTFDYVQEKVHYTANFSIHIDLAE